MIRSGNHDLPTTKLKWTDELVRRFAESTLDQVIDMLLPNTMEKYDGSFTCYDSTPRQIKYEKYKIRLITFTSAPDTLGIVISIMILYFKDGSYECDILSDQFKTDKSILECSLGGLLFPKSKSARMV